MSIIAKTSVLWTLASLVISGCSAPGKLTSPPQNGKSGDAVRVQAAATTVGPQAANPVTDPSASPVPAPTGEAAPESAITTTSDQSGDSQPAVPPTDTPATVPPPLDPAVAKLIDDCGGEKVVKAGPNDTVFTAAMSALGFSVAQSGVTVHLGGSLSISSTPSQTKMAVNIKVASISGLFSIFAGGEANKQAAQNSGTMTYTNVPFSTLPQLGGQYPEWRGIVCSVPAASELVSQIGGKSTTVKFDPPLPTSVQPIAAQSRLDLEIGDQKVFSNIKATVVNSDNVQAKSLGTVIGKVTITKVSPTATVKDDKGVTHKIDADSAYHIVYDFQSPKVTHMLGLTPEVTLYIKSSTHTTIANTVDTSAVGGSVVTFVGP